MKSRVCALMVVGLALTSLTACREDCEVGSGHVGPLRMGAAKDEVLKLIVRHYAVTEQSTPGHAPTLLARARGGRDARTAFVVSLDAGRVSQIDSYERCATPLGVGPGVTLGRAQEIYGAGKIALTELGYFLRFPPNDEIAFLLDQRDIPASLHQVAAGPLSPDNERAVLGLAKARILAVRVTKR